MAYRSKRAALAKRAEHLTLSTFADEAAGAYGDMRAIVLETPFGGAEELSYRQVAEAVARLAGGFARLGVGPGDRVAVCMENSFEALAAQWATWRLGAQLVPINHLTKAAEIRYLVEDSEPKVLVTDAAVFDRNIRERDAVPGVATWVLSGEEREGFTSFASLLEADPAPPHAWKGDEPCVLLYTSGTTGMPKGAVQKADYFADAMRRMAKAAKALPRRKNSFGILGHPLAHVTGLSLAWTYLVAGRPYLLMRRFTGEGFVRAAERDGATFFLGVPAMFKMILDANPDRRQLRSMRVWLVGGDYMPPEVGKAIRRFGGRRLGPIRVKPPTYIETYGSAEVGMAVKARFFGLVRDKRGRVGRPVRVKYAIMDDDGNLLGPKKVGEIVAKDVTTTYHNRPQETEEAWRGGWFHTGDLGYKDRLGRFYVVDRKKDMIKVGGYSVFSREVEEEVAQHPAVREAAVVGVPHPVKGEMPVAVVTLREPVSPDDLLAWCRERIADYKAPRHVEVVDEFPMAAGLKVAKADLRDRLKGLFQ